MKKFKNLDLTAQRLSSRVLNEFNSRVRPVTLKSPFYDQEARKLLEQAKIPCDPSTSPWERSVHWDGESLAVGKQTPDNLLHELAHFQCARPDMWKFPELGMSCGPDGNLPKSKKYIPTGRGFRATIPDSECEMNEEGYASLLGILWERHLGANFYQNLNSHAWIFEGKWEHSDTWQSFRWLLEHGLINGVGRPNLVFRDGNTHITLH